MKLEAWKNVLDKKGSDAPDRGSLTFGEIPSAEELQQAIDDLNGWTMNLKGQDEIVFDYALYAANAEPEVWLLQTGQTMHEGLTALVNAPDIHDFDTTERDLDSGLVDAMDAWQDKYKDHDIREEAELLASDIIQVLGWEWV